MPAPIECALAPVDDIAQIEPIWRTLQERSECSYFLSWIWIGTWLRQLPPHIRPMLFVARESGSVVGLAIMIANRLRRHRVIGSRALFVNTTGDEALDEITIEYNGLLAEPHRREQVTVAALNFLTANGWDEVFINATQVSDAFCLLHGDHWKIRRRIASNAYGVDLRELRRTGKKYLDTLGSSTRYEMRRALRAYEKLGPLRVEAARTQEEADSWFAELRRLHQMYWTGKGFPGAFSNPFLDQFHQELVTKRMAHGEIQLLRISFGERHIAYLYGFVWNDIVVIYQAGLDYAVLPEGNRPGAIAYYAAIEFNNNLGVHYYDFLAGHSQHKQNLSTTTVALHWIVVRRICLKFWIEDALRTIRNRFIALRASASALAKN